MKIYQGHRDRTIDVDWQGRVKVDRQVIVNDSGGMFYPLPVRNDLVNHSPDGFEWGYYGSGPAQLGLAILADFYKIPKTFDVKYKSEDLKIVMRLYQTFKEDFVANLADKWEIKEESIREWLQCQELKV